MSDANPHQGYHAQLLEKLERLERENVTLRDTMTRLHSDCDLEARKAVAAERNNAALRNEVARLNNQTMWICSCGGTDCAGQRENAALRAAIAESEEFARKNGETCSAKIRDLLRENTRLQMELDASCNAEELRQVREENSRLHVELDAYHNGEQLRVLRDCVERTGAANDRLVVQNAALRQALEDMPTCRCGLSTDEQCALSVQNAALRAALAAAEDGLKHALMMEPGDPFARMKAITASLDAVRAVGKEAQP